MSPESQQQAAERLAADAAVHQIIDVSAPTMQDQAKELLQNSFLTLGKNLQLGALLNGKSPLVERGYYGVQLNGPEGASLQLGIAKKCSIAASPKGQEILLAQVAIPEVVDDLGLVGYGAAGHSDLLEGNIPNNYIVGGALQMSF